MEEYIAFDSHKRYTWMEGEQVEGRAVYPHRVEHAAGAIRRAWAGCPTGAPVAVEATANCYWIVKEVEQAGLGPQLVHSCKAKLMMGLINRTDKLDADGLNRLERNATLPTVWIPPGALREVRALSGHSGGVSSLAVSGDRRRAVSASDDQTLKLWDLEMGADVATFSCEGTAYCCAFAGERMVVAGDASGRVQHISAVSAVLRGQGLRLGREVGRSIADTACSSKPRAYGDSMLVGSAGMWRWGTVVKVLETGDGRLRQERKAGRG